MKSPNNNSDIFISSQLIHYMRRANFSLMGARVSFGENGDPVAYYDLMNWHRNPDGSLNLVKVGYYDASLPDERSLVLNHSLIQWPHGKQVCFTVQTGLRPQLSLRLLLVLLMSTSTKLNNTFLNYAQHNLTKLRFIL